MGNQIVLRTRRSAALMLVILMLVSMAGAATVTLAAAQTSGPAPTVGEIVVDDYDCDTGVLNYHVWVTDLPYLDPSTHNGALYYWFSAQYDTGPNYSTPGGTFNPQQAIAPYTGNVSLNVTIPSTNPDGPADAEVASIYLEVSVADGGGGGAVDSSETTYTPDCGGLNDDIVQTIIAILLRILQSISG